MNSPHLRPAYVLDVALHKFSRQIANGDWTDSGLHGHIRSEHDIQVSTFVSLLFIIQSSSVTTTDGPSLSTGYCPTSAQAMGVF